MSCALSNAILRWEPANVVFGAGSVGNNINDGVEMTLGYCAKSTGFLV